MSDRNLEVVRRAWDAWLRGDMDALVADWDPDIVWDNANFQKWPESSYHGVAGIRRFLDEWLEVWGDYEIDIEELQLAPDGRVVGVFTHHGQGSGSGVPMVLEMAQIATVRDGRIVRLDNYDDPSAALQAAGLGERTK